MMTRFQSLAAFACLLLATTTVNAEQPEEADCNPSEQVLVMDPMQQCFDMIAGEDHEGKAAARFCVSMGANSVMHTTVEAADGYTLIRNNVWVGEDLADMPIKKNGSPHYLHFPKHASDFEGVTDTYMKVNFDSHSTPVCASSNQVYLNKMVGHTTVQRVDAYGKPIEGTEQHVYAYDHATEDPNAPWYAHVTLHMECACPVVERRALRGSQL